MKKYLALLLKRAERAYLRNGIVVERPDLVGKRFLVQLRTYRMEAVEEFVRAERARSEWETEPDRDNLPEPPIPHLPPLVARAFDYDPDNTIGYYRAQYELNKERIYRTEEDNTNLRIEHCDLLYDNIGLRKVARDAVDIATNAVGHSARNN